MKKTDRRADPRAQIAEYAAQRHDAYSKYKDVLEARGTALSRVDNDLGPSSQSYKSQKEKSKNAATQLDRIHAVVLRPVIRLRLHWTVSVLFTLGLACLEAPSNKYVFDMVFRSSGIVSFAVSAAATAFLLLFAHFSGRAFRQIKSDYTGKFVVSNFFVSFGCVALAAIVISALTIGRAAFNAETSSIADILTGVGSTVAGKGLHGALLAALQDASAAILATFNVAGFASAAVISFMTHDPDRHYDESSREAARESRRLDRVHAKYLQRRGETIDKYSRGLAGYASNFNSANAAIVGLKTSLNIPLDDFDRSVVTDLDQLAEESEAAEGESESVVHVEPVVEPPVASVHSLGRKSGQKPLQ